MVVVAILGIVSAIAVPNMLPTLQVEALRAGGYAVGAFVSQVRMVAMAERRCVRIRIQSPTAQPILVAEKLNAFDCENPSPPLIDSSQALWMEFSRLSLDRGNLILALNPAPSDTPGEIRFRPNGRIFSADDDLTDDDAILSVSHPELAVNNVYRTVVDSTSLVCTLAASQAPLGSGNNLGCP